MLTLRHSYNGRFSNGPVWCELLASNLSIPLYDYAVGGATTSNALVKGFTGNGSTIPVPSVDEQVSSFINSPPSGIDLSSALFVVSGGANDVFFNPNLSALTSASILSSSVTQLQTAGANNFLFFNYYDIGLIPFSTYTTPFNKAQNAAFSRDLGAALFTLAQSTAGAYYYDLATQLWPHFYFYGEPGDYGFDRYGAYGSCATGVYKETGNLSICNDPEKRVFWDEYHPTARAHEWFARSVLDVLGVKAS